MNQSELESLQVVLACQITQKNAVLGALKQTLVCYWAENSDKSARALECLTLRTSKDDTCARDRLAGAFVSIQLEKIHLRDEMLNSFIKKKELMSTLMSNPEEVIKIKKKMITEFCHKFSLVMSQCCVRSQIIALCYSLTSLLDQLPDINQIHFVVGQAGEIQKGADEEKGFQLDPRTFQVRPRQLLSADGKTVLNLWFIPHYTEVLIMYKTLEEKACFQALQHTLTIVSALHDIVFYLVSLASLGNPKSSLDSSDELKLTADWGGSESIRAELWDIQQQVDSLSEPNSPEVVGRYLQLRREVLFLRFDVAVRCMIREAFLSSGVISSHQSVSNNMSHALSALSDILKRSDSQLPLPQPLDSCSPENQRIFPWRSFLACHGLHPLAPIWDILPIEFSMQLCLSGLNDRSRMEANGAMLGVSLCLDDMLRSDRDAAPLQLQGQADSDITVESDNELLHSTEDIKCVSRKPKEIMPKAHNPIQSLTQQKGFLLLWKQLEVFKESWALQQLGVEQITSVALFKQVSRLYRTEIYYPSMQALAQQMEKEQEYEALLLHNQPFQAPPGATEVDIKTWQLLSLLESTECDMIRAVQRRINKELTLVMSERARHDAALPAELWKKDSMKHCLSLERPQIVENFVQQLMGGGKETDGEVVFSMAHLKECVSELGSAVMARERSSFLLYSQFYEQLLQQQGQLLYQREQDVKDLEAAHIQTNDPYCKVAELCRSMMAEVIALRARVAQLEEEQKCVRQQISLEYKQQYDLLLQQLFSTCIQMKARLDKYHVRMDHDVKQLVSTVRREGVDKIIKLRNKLSITKDGDNVTSKLSEKEILEDLYVENSQLSGLLCKLRAFHHWWQVAGHAKLRRELLQCQQNEISCKLEALGVKMTSQEGEMIVKQELEVVKAAMKQSKTEYEHMKQQIVNQTQQLQDMKHRSVQEVRSQQELESFRMQSVEQLQEDMEQRDTQLRALSAQLEKTSRERELQQHHSHKQIKKVQNQLNHERSLKLEAFQRVDKLQHQIHSMETVLSKHVSNTECKSASSSRASDRKKSLADTSEDIDTETALTPKTASKDSGTLLERPKTAPRRLRTEIADMLLPSLPDRTSTPSTYKTHQHLRLGHK